MLEKGKFFYLLSPQPQGSHYYLDPTQLFKLRNSDERGFDIAKSRYCLNPEIIPSFLFHVYDKKLEGEGKSPRNLLEYPTLPDYKRVENQVTIRPMEVRFEEPSQLVFQSGDYLRCILIKRSGSVVTLPDEFLLALKKNKNYKITFIQNDFAYLMESMQLKEGVDEKTVWVSETSPFPYLSVKDILDPNGGLDRLINDLRTKSDKIRLRYKQKMGVLLDMIRSADSEDEEKIISALYTDDPDFFQEVTDRLLGDDLIPYMDAREISSVLMKATDEVLASMRTQSPQLLQTYKKMISKRRYENISRIPVSDEDRSANSKSLIWQYIEDYFRAHKERIMYAKIQDVGLKFVENEPKVNSIIPQQYSSEILTSDSQVIVNAIKPGSVELKIQAGLKNLYLYARLSKGVYVDKYYRHVPAGILVVPMEFLPHSIICGALTTDNKLVESISFCKKLVC